MRRFGAFWFNPLNSFFIKIQKYPGKKIGGEQGERDQSKEEADDGIVARIEDRRRGWVHNVVSRRKDQAQYNDEEDVRDRCDPVCVDQPESHLQEDACHGEDHRQAEARLGKEEAVPIGIHGPERKRKIGYPEEDTCAPERGRPLMEDVAFCDEGDHACQRRGGKRQLCAEHPCPVQVYDPHIGTKGFLFGPEQS